MITFESVAHVILIAVLVVTDLTLIAILLMPYVHGR